jgi:hypothetical protein
MVRRWSVEFIDYKSRKWVQPHIRRLAAGRRAAGPRPHVRRPALIGFKSDDVKFTISIDDTVLNSFKRSGRQHADRSGRDAQRTANVPRA